jgi:hypothetical protein
MTEKHTHSNTTLKNLNQELSAIKNAIKSGNLREAFQVISSLNAYEAGSAAIQDLINEIRVIQENEKLKERRVYNSGKDYNLIASTGLTELEISLKKIAEEEEQLKIGIAKTSGTIAYILEKAKENEERYNSAYEDIADKYVLRPQDINIAKEILKIEKIRITENKSCSKALNKELSTLNYQSSKLEEARQAIQKKLERYFANKRDYEASSAQPIIREAEIMLLSIKSEISSVIQLIEKTKSKLEIFNIVKENAEQRIREMKQTKNESSFTMLSHLFSNFFNGNSIATGKKAKKQILNSEKQKQIRVNKNYFSR